MSSATSRSDLRLVGRYAALGDSFTAGFPDQEVEGSWADELAATLRFANPQLEFRNLANAGASSDEVAEQQLQPALAFEPDLITLVCGANDVLLSVRPDIGAYAARFSEMLETIGERLPEAAVVTTTCPDFSGFLGFGPRSRERVAKGMLLLNEATRSVARRHGVLCLDFAAHPRAGSRGSFAADGYHPSPDASRRAAAAFLEAIAERYGIRTIPVSGETSGVDTDDHELEEAL